MYKSKKKGTQKSNNVYDRIKTYKSKRKLMNIENANAKNNKASFSKNKNVDDNMKDLTNTSSISSRKS